MFTLKANTFVFYNLCNGVNRPVQSYNLRKITHLYRYESNVTNRMNMTMSDYPITSWINIVTYYPFLIWINGLVL